MGYQQRAEIIQQIEKLRGSKVVTYFNSDRRSFPPGSSLPALTTQLSTEAQIILYEQLRILGKTDRIDLFLYTRGGEVDSVWPLVSIFREYAREKFSVLIPFRAHSAGTLICLGADQIVMGEAAELSPVDPTTGNQFNPLDEGEKRSRKGISVEDVTSYMELAKDDAKVGLQDSNHILEVFKRLSQEVHPLALGNVNRAHTQIRILADKLMRLHFVEEEEAVHIGRIVDQLTKGLYSHNHALNRKETQELLGKELVSYASDEEENLLWKLYEAYAQTLHLRETFCRDTLISDETQQEHTIDGGFIETREKSFIYRAKCQLELHSQLPQNVQMQLPPGQPMPLIPGFPVAIDVKVTSVGWENNQEGV
ncbi:MAG: hypothetical protein JXA21_11245 [Anaerolineae bacterium]|nr:hypothetical protein [Anaerolineae bacterium]